MLLIPFFPLSPIIIINFFFLSQLFIINYINIFIIEYEKVKNGMKLICMLWDCGNYIKEK